MYEKIKDEVRKLMNCRDSRLVDGSYFDFEHLLHFIESLEKEQPEEPKIKGWVARDGEPKFGKLLLFGAKPIRGAKRDNTELNWVLSKNIPANFNVWALPNEMFSELKWEDEPIEVELSIILIKNEEKNTK